MLDGVLRVSGNVASTIGLLTALYAAMQFVFAPLLGALSDRLGRRPVLLASMGGAAIDYLLLAWAPQLWVLFVGRAIAGLTAANVSVAMAYITDVSREDQRAQRFGIVNAMFGAGFIIGPVLGGVLGSDWLPLPFLAAAVLNGCNLLLALFALPESRASRGGTLDLGAFNPLRPLAWMLSTKGLAPIVLVYVLLSGAGEAYGVCWALWGSDAFGWDGTWIGLSLGMFGVCQTLVQAFAASPAARRLGERGAVVCGLAGSCLALVAMAAARQGWVVFAVMPVFALGGMGTPAFQALATRQVDAARQGQLQGLLASAVSLTSVVAPLAFTTVYFAVQRQWPGAVWLSVVAVQIATIPVVLLGGRAPRDDARPPISCHRSDNRDRSGGNCPSVCLDEVGQPKARRRDREADG